MALPQTVAQTLADVSERRPALEPILRVFEPLLSAWDGLTGELAESLRAGGAALPEPNDERVRNGVSLLAGAGLKGVSGSMRASAERLLPLLASIEAVAPHLPALTAYFLRRDEDGERSHEALAEAVAARDGKAVERLAVEHDLDHLMLDFVAGFVVSAVLRAMVAEAMPEDGERFWDKNDSWRQGYCPVCGDLPIMGWLDKPVLDEKNAFLAGGGGKKHLHCGQCGADWKFRRGACPSCGEEGSGVVESLHESGNAHGERLDWCTKCKSYCPIVDLREREFVPHLDAAAFGMMHLAMIAARKRLQPLRPSFWNMF